MEVGTVLEWKKAEGDALSPQDVLAEVETDKAAMEIEVFDSGFLLKILADAGDQVPAGQPIAILGGQLVVDLAASGWSANNGRCRCKKRPMSTR